MSGPQINTGVSKTEVDAITTPAPAPSVNSTELDDAYALYKNGDATDVDPAEAKRVLRKIDFRIVPVLFVIYMLQYLDKNGINYASVYGLQKGTNLKGDDYSWLGSIFYFGEPVVIMSIVSI